MYFTGGEKVVWGEKGSGGEEGNKQWIKLRREKKGRRRVNLGSRKIILEKPGQERGGGGQKRGREVERGGSS